MADEKGNSDRDGPDPASGSAQLLRLADYDRVQPGHIIAEMRDYWHGLRRGRAIPARSDVEPRGISRALDYAFILERIAPGAARMRLAGRHLIDLMGMEVRGMPICAFLQSSSRGRLSDVLESVFKAPQIAELTLNSRGEYARPELNARMLLLPLRSDLGDVTRALGCLISDGETGVAPRRFDLVADRVLPIIEGGTTVAPSPSGFSEPPSRFDGVETPKRRRGDAKGAPAAPLPDPGRTATPEERRAGFRVVTD